MTRPLVLNQPYSTHYTFLGGRERVVKEPQSRFLVFERSSTYHASHISIPMLVFQNPTLFRVPKPCILLLTYFCVVGINKHSDKRTSMHLMSPQYDCMAWYYFTRRSRIAICAIQSCNCIHTQYTNTPYYNIVVVWYCIYICIYAHKQFQNYHVLCCRK